jgi:hypothetical protein
MSETSIAVRQSSTVQSCFETFQFNSVAGSTRAACLYSEPDYRRSEPRRLEAFDSEKFRNSSNPIFGWNAQIAAIPGRIGERVKSAVRSPIEVQKGQVERMPACGCLAAVAQPARTASARREGLARLRADKA